jgi:hypothetical protein
MDGRYRLSTPLAFAVAVAPRIWYHQYLINALFSVACRLIDVVGAGGAALRILPGRLSRFPCSNMNNRCRHTCTLERQLSE